MSKTENRTKDKISISKKLQQLDESVEWFYGEDFELDQAVAKYESAIKTAQEIKQDLTELKNKVEVIGDFTKS